MPYFLSLPLVILRSYLIVVMSSRLAKMFEKLVPLKKWRVGVAGLSKEIDAEISNTAAMAR